MSVDQSPYTPPSAKLQQGDSPTDDILCDFLGEAADYYLPKWGGLRAGTRSLAGFNWAAAFFPVLWLLYRKLFVWALGWFVVSSGLTLLASDFAIVLRLAEFLVLGSIANVLLFKRANAVIGDAKLQPPEAAAAYVRSKGGTSEKAVWAMLALYLILGVVSVIATLSLTTV